MHIKESQQYLRLCRQEIDKMVCELDSFIEDEIKIVEGEQDGFSTDALMAIKADEKRREHHWFE